MSPLTILRKILSEVMSYTGGLPVYSSYRRIPRLHQSTAALWPCYLIISGAMYSGVPQTEYVSSLSSNSIPSLDRPKSVNFKWPFLPIKIFSGFMSRYIIPLLCSWPRKVTISDAKNLISFSLKVPFYFKWKKSSPPATYSMTKYNLSSV